MSRDELKLSQLSELTTGQWFLTWAFLHAGGSKAVLPIGVGHLLVQVADIDEEGRAGILTCSII